MHKLPENMKQWFDIAERLFPGTITLVHCEPHENLPEFKMIFEFSYCGLSFQESFLNCCPQDHMEQAFRKVLEKFMQPLIKYHSLI